ncbi:PQQ-dependent sugar dehydrogenase [Antribacter sp. KLBMP9083]|uniref:PQQ-dependent sugar dehydrogenase n=1 Tax=Antribacter soli TaxID=2910976 RepID=A0AA41QAM3_9MICO|nr:PQQ-dependent sugar dehydrogenase [Antribacter soli]MCF4119935.1 PQQ-dependent sugar dehydrogenase [Antribacter soli]
MRLRRPAVAPVRRRSPALVGAVVTGVLAVGFLAGCSPSQGPGVVSPSPPATTGGGDVTAGGGPPASDIWDGAVEATAATVADGLPVPWGLAPLADGRLLVSLRDEARLVVVEPASGQVLDVTGPGAERLAAETRPRSEAGLLGVVVAPEGEVFVYRTGADDNAVLRGTLDGAVLGPLTVVVSGIPAAANHDGGRLALGPDGYLYVSTGDAGLRDAAQDPGSLAGKILRVTRDGEPAPGNPDPASPVWSLGHRNVQGLGWDASGRMFASEFGQNTLDELNVIKPGANYGWPEVEGPGGASTGFVDPVAWWPTTDASPSGLAVTDEAVYLAGLRGERLWRVPLLGTPDEVAAGTSPGFGQPQELLAGEYGRLRAVLVAGPGELYVLTGNTDGRGDPREGDDRLLRVTVLPAG